MQNLIQLWINPINLGICFCALRSASGSWRTVIQREKIDEFHVTLPKGHRFGTV
jgi:hypothetical protein